MKYLRVKEYAKLIKKSERVVYKMVKEGIVTSKMNGKKIEILVDEHLYAIAVNADETQQLLFTKIQELEKRLSKVESSITPKIIVKSSKTLNKLPTKKHVETKRISQKKPHSKK